MEKKVKKILILEKSGLLRYSLACMIEDQELEVELVRLVEEVGDRTADVVIAGENEERDIVETINNFVKKQGVRVENIVFFNMTKIQRKLAEKAGVIHAKENFVFEEELKAIIKKLEV